jgi:hypothetical protein
MSRNPGIKKGFANMGGFEVAGSPVTRSFDILQAWKQNTPCPTFDARMLQKGEQGSSLRGVYQLALHQIAPDIGHIACAVLSLDGNEFVGCIRSSAVEMSKVSRW